MEMLSGLLGPNEAARLVAQGGDPVWFVCLLAVVLIALFGVFSPRLPWVLRAMLLIIFVVSDGAALFLIFKANPGLTDYTYGSATDSPPVEIAASKIFQESAPVCFSAAGFDAAQAMEQVVSACSNGGSARQNNLMRLRKGDQLCLVASVDPQPGQECHVSGHLHWTERRWRDGPLQWLHQRMGISAPPPIVARAAPGHVIVPAQMQ